MDVIINMMLETIEVPMWVLVIIFTYSMIGLAVVSKFILMLKGDQAP